MLQKGMDHLVLGCTHYPYLIPLLKELLPGSVKIIDSGQAVAKQTKAILEQYNLRSNSLELPIHQFYSNTDSSILAGFVPEKDSCIKVAYLDF